ncbi:MAG: ABC transporter permease subunit [Candidatus Hydrogenedentes bacterium]|nr:ABC transporter permease subunit [Candidatus Hydrogenedentota bacterium]
MIRQAIGNRWMLALGVVSVVALLGGYAALSHHQHQINPDDRTIPTWSQLKDGFVKIVGVNARSDERWLVVDAKATGKRLFLGLLCGVGGAMVLGMMMGCLAPVEAVLHPPLAMLAKLPPTAMLAVFFVLVGTDTNMYVAMIAFGVLPSLAQSVYLAVKDVPDEFLYKAYTLGASHIEVVWNVVFRQVMPRLIDSIRLQLGPAMVYLIAAEMVVGDVGFGYRIRLQSKLLNMDVVYPYLVILAVFGFSMDYALLKLQRKICPWCSYDK